MSSHFGPIHYKLYEKIMFLVQMDEYVKDSLHGDVQITLKNIPLESAIKEDNIHMELQQMIQLEQQEHAAHIEMLYGIDKKKLQLAIESYAHKFRKDISFLEIPTWYDATFLTGMPCDRNLMMVDSSPEKITLRLKEDIARNYYEDPTILAWEREVLMQSMLPSTIAFQQDEDTFSFLYKENTK